MVRGVKVQPMNIKNLYHIADIKGRFFRVYRPTNTVGVLSEGPILDWTNDGKPHEHFLGWKKNV